MHNLIGRQYRFQLGRQFDFTLGSIELKSHSPATIGRFFYLPLLLLLLLGSRPALAWNLQLGIHHLMPKLWTGEQTYRSDAGPDLKFKPVINKTITGQTASIGFFYENILFHFEQGQYHYRTDIPAGTGALTTDTSAKVEIMEQRLGINYHLERELAGLFVGVGMTREQEKVNTSQDQWQFEDDVPFLKFGIDLILGAWRIRVEQVHYTFGEHSAKISSAGILLYL